MKGPELLGYKCQDRVTGFVGVATGFCQYLSGCHQILLVPTVAADGAFRDGQWFDQQRVLLLPAESRVTLDNGATPGFDKEAPKR
jgi:hypothetical protein